LILYNFIFRDSAKLNKNANYSWNNRFRALRAILNRKDIFWG
jgi:hypothetical protein